MNKEQKEYFTLHVTWCGHNDRWEIVEGYLKKGTFVTKYCYTGTFDECKERLLSYDYFDQEHGASLDAFHDYLNYPTLL
jgi:hypothetical protein